MFRHPHAARAAVSMAAASMISLGGLAASSPATASSTHAHARSKASVASSYNHRFSSKIERGRNHRHLKSYAGNRHLAAIAMNWAKHMAKTGQLEHNPKLVQKVNKACPNWTSFGENVGYSEAAQPADLYQAYMHSPPHRANILDRSYRQIGIATVSITRDGQTVQWNVMDFGAGCPK